MKSFGSLGAFAAHLRRVAQSIPAAEQHGLEQAAVIVETEAKAEIGQEMPEWPALAVATVSEKERLGYTGHVSATDPLLREGTLRDSISHTVDGRTAVVGSDDPVAIYQETGTNRIPPRPFLGSAAFRKGKEAAKAAGQAVANVVAGLPPGRGG